MRSFNTNLRKTGISRRHVYFQFLLPVLPFLLFLLRRGLDFHSAVLSKAKPLKVHLDKLLQVVASVKLGLNTITIQGREQPLFSNLEVDE